MEKNDLKITGVHYVFELVMANEKEVTLNSVQLYI